MSGGTSGPYLDPSLCSLFHFYQQLHSHILIPSEPGHDLLDEVCVGNQEVGEQGGFQSEDALFVAASW